MISPVANPHPFVKLCGACAPFTSVLLTLSPLPTLLNVAPSNLPPVAVANINDDAGNTASKRATIASLPLLPYSSMMVNSALWTLYGLSIRSAPVWMCNSVGIFLGLAYCALFVMKSGGLSSSSSRYLPLSSPVGSAPLTINDRNDLPSTFKSHVYLSSFILVVALHFFRQEARVNIAIMANLVCAVMFMSPLSSLQRIIKRGRCPKGAIPLPFTATQGLNCVLWTVYGKLALRDVAVWGPNAFGLACAFAQATVKVLYGEERGRATS